MADVAVLGVDGRRGGWVGALLDGTDVTWLLLPDAASVLAVDAAAVAVDIPMGLPARGPRRCDRAARRLLGTARSSVFPAPPRALVERPASTYGEALAWLRGQGLGGLSAQAHGIVGKVREFDALLTRDVQQRVVEAHPEVVFRRLAGLDALASKKTARGAGQRLTALDRWLPGVARHLDDDALAAVPLDDALDALACAWTAQRWLAGTAGPLDGIEDVDDRGLLMRIVV